MQQWWTQKKLWSKITRGENTFEDLDADLKIILKRIVEKQDVRVWVWFNCTRMWFHEDSKWNSVSVQMYNSVDIWATISFSRKAVYASTVNQIIVVIVIIIIIIFVLVSLWLIFVVYRHTCRLSLHTTKPSVVTCCNSKEISLQQTIRQCICVLLWLSQ